MCIRDSCIARPVLPRVAGVSPQDVPCYATTRTVLPGGNVRTRGAGGSLSVNPTPRAQQIAEVRPASYGISSWKQISTACHQGASDRREAYSSKEERQEEGHSSRIAKRELYLIVSCVHTVARNCRSSELLFTCSLLTFNKQSRSLSP